MGAFLHAARVFWDHLAADTDVFNERLRRWREADAEIGLFDPDDPSGSAY